MAEPLLDAIDATALKLLRKISGDSNIEAKDSSIFVEQVKAFGEVVKWAGLRPTLMPKEEKETKFAGLKRDFHGAATGRRRGVRAAEAEAGPAAPADAGSDSAAGAAEDD